MPVRTHYPALHAEFSDFSYSTIIHGLQRLISRAECPGMQVVTELSSPKLTCETGQSTYTSHGNNII